jgi:hypothetical protein
MPAPPLLRRSSDKAAALIIVLAFVVLLTGLSLAYFSRTTSERQLAHSSYNDTSANLLARSALDVIVSNLRQEIVNGSTATTVNGTTIYVPRDTGSGPAANMVPQRSGNLAAAPNLIRRSVSPDNILNPPGLPSFASAVNSAPIDPANPKRGDVTKARWNEHYLVPKLNTGDDGTEPIAAFTAPDWVFVTGQGPIVITSQNSSVIGRYSYAVYDEGGLLDMNVAGYPTDPSSAPVPAQRVGRKGSIAFADLAALGSSDAFRLSNPDTAGVYQTDRLVGWRNYATTQPGNNFPDNNFAANFQSDPSRATAYFTSIINNTSGFLTASTATWNNRTDQVFPQRQELIAFRKAVGSTTSFSANALQYLSTFSRETNAPSFSPPTPTSVNPNFLLIRVTGSFTRFDGTAAVAGEPLVKTRFPLSRLAWITYKGPSAVVYAANPNDPVILALTSAGVSTTTIQAGTANNIKKCFGLVWDSRTYVPATATTNSQGQQWVYISPSTANTGGNFDPVSNPTGNPASDIKTLATVASENREPDFFELLRAGILDTSLGLNTGGGVTFSATADAQGANTFPDLHMSNKALHVLTIGASIIDQADPDSIPTRIQVQPSGASVWWTAYGVESLPYITQIYPIAGTSPANPNQWATYLLFQLWNPHIGAALPTSAPQVRLRLDGNIGIFSNGGNNLTWAAASNKQTFTVPPTGVPVTQMALTGGALGPGSTPVPLSTPGVAATGPGVGTATLPGFETLPPPSSGPSIANYVGLRLPDFALGAGSPSAPVIGLYFGTLSTAQFNATMECTVDGGTTWIPYNHFIGITDRNSTIGVVTGSWMNGATVPVRTASSTTGLPSSSLDQFNATRLTDSPIPDCLMKADPRATRFGIFQFKQTQSSTTARITDPLWPLGNANYANGYGGSIADSAGPVEHAPRRFSTAGGGNNIYFPATLCINNAASSSTRTSYADGDGVIRPADATNTEAPATGPTTGSWTPYYATSTDPTSTDYHPIMLNRPFRNVGELGYAFRDLPWKTLDFFTDKSADAGLLDIFTINDGSPLFDTSTPPNIIGMAIPTMVAGNVNLNSTQASDLQSVLAGAIVDEISSTTVSGTGTGAADAPALASQIVSATSTTPMQNKSELLTRSGFPILILPVPGAGAAHPQRVKPMREVVVRAVSSVAQTRVWNVVIDVVAQTGHYKPNATSLADFVVEGEQRYWVHVAIDRFTLQVLERQVEVVKE